MNGYSWHAIIWITVAIVCGLLGFVGIVIGLCLPWLEQRREHRDRLRQRDAALKRHRPR
jgi:hypothetical protein